MKNPSQNASFWESALLALDSLRGSKLRSFLTLLGVILATTTLIAVMSVIHGMDIYIAETVSDMGADGFRVVRMAFLGDWDPKKFLEMQRKHPLLNENEFAFLKQHVTLTRELGMMAGRSGKTAYQGDSIDGIGVNGSSANYGTLTNTQPAFGRMFTDADDAKHLSVVVIGWDVRERFFPNVDPTGKTITVDGRPFEVIGVAKAKGSVFGESQDMFVCMPIQTYFKTYGSRRGLEYMALAKDQSYLIRAQDEIRTLLRSYRHLGPKADDSFMLLNSDSLVSAWGRLTGAIAATAVAVVSVFMVVGGVVIMNIMLAVVTERTREIGIRKSVGARRRDILNQFLVESSVLSGIGGLIGVLISWALAIAVRNTTSIPMAMPFYAIFLGVGLSLITGLFFGIYPAQRAAKLDPIEALRAEA
ncbi:multidrug ABC transporter substrate-binding protein [Bryobacterales bacterium F-183]|nr:multidrug ABC transporter substrate-binding protein [Bryobacterales bacterium F-183]